MARTRKKLHPATAKRIAGRLEYPLGYKPHYKTLVRLEYLVRDMAHGGIVAIRANKPTPEQVAAWPLLKPAVEESTWTTRVRLPGPDGKNVAGERNVQRSVTRDLKVGLGKRDQHSGALRPDRQCGVAVAQVERTAFTKREFRRAVRRAPLPDDEADGTFDWGPELRGAACDILHASTWAEWLDACGEAASLPGWFEWMNGPSIDAYDFRARLSVTTVPAMPANMTQVVGSTGGRRALGARPVVLKDVGGAPNLRWVIEGVATFEAFQALVGRGYRATMYGPNYDPSFALTVGVFWDHLTAEPT